SPHADHGAGVRIDGLVELEPELIAGIEAQVVARLATAIVERRNVGGQRASSGSGLVLIAGVGRRSAGGPARAGKRARGHRERKEGRPTGEPHGGESAHLVVPSGVRGSAPNPLPSGLKNFVSWRIKLRVTRGAQWSAQIDTPVRTIYAIDTAHKSTICIDL